MVLEEGFVGRGVLGVSMRSMPPSLIGKGGADDPSPGDKAETAPPRKNTPQRAFGRANPPVPPFYYSLWHGGRGVGVWPHAGVPMVNEATS